MKIDIKDYKLLCHKGSGEYNEDIVKENEENNSNESDEKKGEE